MKEVIGKARKTRPLLPSKTIVNNLEINEEKRIANKFDHFFIDIGPELANEISEPARSIESHIPKSNTIMPTGPISVNEFKNAFFLVKTNKCPGHDEININVIKSCLGERCEPLQYLLTLYFEKSIVSDNLTISKVTPVFTAGDNTELSNYRNSNNILLEKSEINGIVGKNLQWFKNYLNNRKQCIQINNEEKRNLLLVKCDAPQGSILGSLLFLI